MSDPEQQVVFALAPGENGGPLILILLIPEAAWDYMKDSKTHNIDLTKVGMPIQIVLAGCKDRAAAMAILAQTMDGQKTIDMRNVDFSIEPPPGPGKGH